MQEKSVLPIDCSNSDIDVLFTKTTIIYNYAYKCKIYFINLGHMDEYQKVGALPTVKR